jgi:hypothetical protein
MLLLVLGSAGWARTWCAAPIVAHEWGVTALRPGGGVVLPTELPPWFARSGVEPLAGPRVRDLPADSGERTLPVVQFWAPGGVSGEVPAAATVGFTQGSATVWFPPVDVLALHDPKAQLQWESLTLTTHPTGALGVVGGSPWVERLRTAPPTNGAGPLWVNRGADSERFLFYEGRTREVSAVVAAPEGDGWTVHNRSDWPVHDVWLVRDGRRGHVVRLEPGATQRVRFDAAVDAAWRSEVWSGLVDTTATPPEPCLVQNRDPATPAQRPSGHQLYASEVDTMFQVWGPRLLAATPHLMYREDPAALDAVMPVSLYTDMAHWFDWRRLGLVLVEDDG